MSIPQAWHNREMMITPKAKGSPFLDSLQRIYISQESLPHDESPEPWSDPKIRNCTTTSFIARTQNKAFLAEQGSVKVEPWTDLAKGLDRPFLAVNGLHDSLSARRLDCWLAASYFERFWIIVSKYDKLQSSMWGRLRLLPHIGCPSTEPLL